MKEKVNHIISLVLVIALCLPMVASASASINVTGVDANNLRINRDELFRALHFVESYKESFGLESVDFSTLKIGNVIHAYEYVGEKFQEVAGFYPLFNGTTLVALVLFENGECSQIMTALTKEISAANRKNISLIYDANGCYLYDGVSFLLIASDSLKNENRSILPTNAENDAESLVLSDLGIAEPLGYTSSAHSRSSERIYCDVDVILQGRYENICWAACIACINNYVNGSNLTAVDVAVKQTGSYDSKNFNHTMTTTDATIFMNEKYNLGYKFNRGSITATKITRNLYNNFPIYGVFTVSPDAETGHAGTICGIELFDLYFWVMDPMYGIIGSKYSVDGTFEYVSPYSYNTLGLRDMVCRYAN